MLRTIAAVSALGLLALVLMVTLIGGPEGPGALRNANTGEPITLEAVQRDLIWHRDTAEKLRQLD
ncbi:MAG: hypothetical protein RH942_03230 [Kiloniellaceae bacterium]